MTERIESLDTIKGLAILAVVIIHIRGNFLNQSAFEGLFDLIGFSIARFGVPLFFLISGFLLKKKFEERKEKLYTLKYIKKIAIYYILASGLYLGLQTGLILLEATTGVTLPRDISMDTSLVDGLYNFLYTGYVIRGSLWFFPALAISTTLIYISEKYGKFNLLLATSGILHLIGILTNTYQVIDVPIPPRDALFFGLVYTSIGFKIGQIGKEKISRHLNKITLALGLFLILNIIENLFLVRATATSFIHQDYSLLTLPFAVSILLLGLAKPNLGSETRINTYGKYTLLGYILHQIGGGILTGATLGIDSLTGLTLVQNSTWNIILTGLTYILTMEAVIKYRKDLELQKFF